MVSTCWGKAAHLCMEEAEKNLLLWPSLFCETHSAVNLLVAESTQLDQSLHDPVTSQRTPVSTWLHQGPGLYHELLGSLKILSIGNVKETDKLEGGAWQIQVEEEAHWIHTLYFSEAAGELLSVSLERAGDPNEERLATKPRSSPWEIGMWKSFFLLGVIDKIHISTRFEVQQ